MNDRTIKGLPRCDDERLVADVIRVLAFVRAYQRAWAEAQRRAGAIVTQGWPA